MGQAIGRIIGLFFVFISWIISWSFLPGWAIFLSFFPWVAGLFFLATRFLTVQEGYCAAITRGGEFRRFSIRYQGKGFDDQWNVVDAPTSRRFFGGLVAVWFFDRAHKYFLTWKTLKQDGTVTPHTREELDRVLLKDKVYYVEISEAEEAELMPLKIKLLLTIRIVNPYEAIFLVDDYLQVVIDRIAPAARNATTQESYKDLIARKNDLGQEIFNDSSDTIDFLLNTYGVKVVSLAVLDIDPSEDEDRKATEEPVRAKLAAEATLIKARAKADSDVIQAKGESEAEYYAEFGPMLHALAKSHNLMPDDFLAQTVANADWQAELKESVERYQKLHSDVEKMKQNGRFELVKESSGNASAPTGTGGGIKLIDTDTVETLVVLLKKLGVSLDLSGKQPPPSSGQTTESTEGTGLSDEEKKKRWQALKDKHEEALKNKSLEKPTDGGRKKQK